MSFGAQIASLLVQIECASGGGARLRREDGAAPLIGSSAATHAVRERIERVAVTDFTVLIEGETGTGNELVAKSRTRRGARRAAHTNGPR